MTKSNNAPTEEVLDSAGVKFIKEYHVNPLEKRVNELERRLSVENLNSLCQKIFNEHISRDAFRSRFSGLFNEALKVEHFINKVKTIARGEITSNRQNTIAKAILYVGGGFLLALLGGLAQKFLNIF